MTASTRAASSTDWQIGPTTSMVEDCAMAPRRLTSPAVLRSATTPAELAALRSELTVSVPSAHRLMPVATATAEPPLEPAANRVGS
nr:hypothetical protein [Achromobacter xylosoxidans]